MKINYIFRKRALNMVLPCLFGLIAILASCGDDDNPPPDDEAPGNATDFIASVDGTSITLTWTAPSDDDLAGYTLTYTPGNVSSNLGLVTTSTIDDLSTGTEYTFTLVSIDEGGNTSSGVSVAATITGGNGNSLPFSEDFESSCSNGGLPSDWLIFSSASNIDWECVDLTGVGDGGFGAQANSFGGDVPAEDWLITPALELPSGNSAFLSFNYSSEFSDVDGFGLEARISTDFSGEGDPADATWTTLDAGIDNTRSDNTLVTAVASLSAHSGTAYIAFYYTSSGTEGGEGSRVRVDNVSVTNDQATSGVALPYSEDFEDSCQGDDGTLPADWTIFSSASNIDWVCVDLTGVGDGGFGAQANSFGGDVPAQDWLITPGLALPAGNAAFLSFNYSSEFSDIDGFGLEARISTDYSGSGDPSSATWAALDAGIDNTRSDNTLVTAVASLSAHSGTAYIAFYYTSSGTEGGEGSRVRVDNVSVTNDQATSGVALPYSEDFEDSCQGDDGTLPADWTIFSSASNIDWVCVDLTGVGDGGFGAQANSFGGDVAAQDWLITPGLSLAAGNAAFLSFDYSSEFSDVEGFGLEARISTDYSGSGDPSSATWTTLDADIDNTREDNTFVNAVAPLSSFSGTAYIAFYYTSSGTEGGEGSRVRVDNISISE